MATKIQKGGNLPLVQVGIHRGQCFVGLGWAFPENGVYEVDASAFVLSENGKVCSNGSFIFYNQASDDLGGFVNLLDSAAAPAGTQEPLASTLDRQGFMLDLNKAPHAVARIVFCLTLHEAGTRQQNFALAEHLHLRVVDPDTGREALRFHAENEFTAETAISVGELYRHNDGWKFRAVGQGYAGGLEALALGFGVKLEGTAAEAALAAEPTMEDAEHTDDSDLLTKKKKRSANDVLAAQAVELRAQIKPLLPLIMSALQGGANESNSRLILDKILQQVLGYSIEEIKTEQRIGGRSADYVLSPGGVDIAVIEAKRIGGALKEKQIFQATSYAAYAGIKWAILTNILVWRLYKISTVDKIEPHLVFTVDLSKGISEEAAHYLTLISRTAIVRKTPLDRLWLLRRALSTESLISAILHEDVLARIRKVVAQENGIHLDIADIKSAVEKDILKLD